MRFRKTSCVRRARRRSTAARALGGGLRIGPFGAALMIASIALAIVVASAAAEEDQYDELGLRPPRGESGLAIPDPVLDPRWLMPEPGAPGEEPEKLDGDEDEIDPLGGASSSVDESIPGAVEELPAPGALGASGAAVLGARRPGAEAVPQAPEPHDDMAGSVEDLLRRGPADRNAAPPPPAPPSQRRQAERDYDEGDLTNPAEE